MMNKFKNFFTKFMFFSLKIFSFSWIKVIITIFMVAIIKYTIHENIFHVTNSLYDIGFILSTWLISTGIIDFISNMLGIKYINIFNKDKMCVDNYMTIKYKVEDFKIKRFYGMNSNNNITEDTNMDTDIDMNDETNMDTNMDNNMSIPKNENLNILGVYIDEYRKLVTAYRKRRMDKELGITGNIFVDRLKERIRKLAEGKPNINLVSDHNPWDDTNNKSPSTIFVESLEIVKTNPGPGFNAPGNDIPLRAEICKHLNYNYSIVRQFKYMNLEKAIEQRNNYITLINTLNSKLENANIILSNLDKILNQEERIFTENNVLFQKKKIIDSRNFNSAKIHLLDARIEFIQLKLEEIARNNNK